MAIGLRRRPIKGKSPLLDDATRSFHQLVMATVSLHQGFLPGSIGRIIEMHGAYYQRHWNLTQEFEARVALGLGEFAARYRQGDDLVLLALHDDAVCASLILDLNDPSSAAHFAGLRCAHLRFFILDDALRGTGIGKKMLDRAMAHIDAHAEGRCWLTTFGGLDAARSMYERRGFVLVEEEVGTRWGSELQDQTFRRAGKAGV